MSTRLQQQLNVSNEAKINEKRASTDIFDLPKRLSLYFQQPLQRVINTTFVLQSRRRAMFQHHASRITHALCCSGDTPLILQYLLV